MVLFSVGKYYPSTRVSLSFIIFLGSLACGLNFDLPIVRNANIYAVVTDLLLQGEYAVSQIVSNYDLGLGKPILYSIFSMPFVKIWGLSQGMVISSFVSSIIFLICSFLFFNHFNKVLGLEKHLTGLQILLTFFNPLVIYQFWSAYPDSLFAALSITALLVLDKTIRENKYFFLKTLFYFVLIYLCILTKYVGAVLPLAHLIYIFFHLKVLKKNILPYPKKCLWVATLAMILSLAILASLFGENPTLSMGHGSGGGFEGEFNFYEMLFDIPTNILSFLCALFFVFNAMVFFLFGFYKHIKFHPLLATAAVILIPYFIFWASYFNIRFYLPLLPICTLIISSVYAKNRRRTRSAGLLMLFLFSNTVFIALFNQRDLYERTFAKMTLPPFFDNLRMSTHLERSCLFKALGNLESVGLKRPVLQWTFDYYRAIDLKYLQLQKELESIEFRKLDQFSNSLAGPDNLFIYAFFDSETFTKEIPTSVKIQLSKLKLKKLGCNLYKVEDP